MSGANFIRRSIHCRSTTAACRFSPSWLRSIATQTEIENPANNTQIPMLMLSSRTKPKIRFLYDITVGEITREIKVPSMSGHHIIGSSQGFLFSLDKEAEIHATNPLTGAHLSLPSVSTLPNMAGVLETENTITHYLYSPSLTSPRELDKLPLSDMVGDKYCHKAIASPLLDFVVLIEHGMFENLAFAKLSNNEDSNSSPASWIALVSPLEQFRDIIFHKGLLHAVNEQGTLAVFDLNNPSGLPLLSPKGPMTTQCFQNIYLVESPDGEDLFLVFKTLGYDDIIKVFKLDKKNNYNWNLVDDIGDAALFVGWNNSVALPASKFPALKRNSVYFTRHHPHKPEYDEGTGVYNIESASFELYSLKKGRQQLNWLPPIWYMPGPL